MKNIAEIQKDARYRFFGQFNLPEAKFIDHIGWLEASYREFIERAYHASRSQFVCAGAIVGFAKYAWDLWRT